MNVDNLISKFNDLKQYLGMAGFSELKTSGHVLNQQEMIIVGVTILIGLLWCFLGLKLFRVWAAIAGFLIGFGVGSSIAVIFSLNTRVIYIIAILGGILIAVLSTWLYHLGMFILVWILVGGLCISLLRPQSWEMYLLCIAVGLIFGIITFKLADPMIVIVTAVCGSIAVGEGAGVFVKISGMVQIIGVAVLCVAGMVVQFVMYSGKMKRLHLKKAKETQQAHSSANDVDRAREFLNSAESVPAEEEKKTE